MDLIVARPEGLYCPAGDFHIDPWRSVERAVITHGHSDHAREGSAHYLAAKPGEGILRKRLGADIDLHAMEYGESVVHNGVKISLHPAGHVLGSSQVRLEHEGQVWVASGDYKLDADGTCLPFEHVRCHAFISESTFGLPIYRWVPQPALFADINTWWAANADAGRCSVLFAYAFGKAQRLLSGLDVSIGPILCHGAVEPLNKVYREAGVALPATQYVSEVSDPALLRRAMVIAPPSAQGSTWMRRFGDYSDGFASGWMQLRGTRRRKGVDRGFVMSDHADWDGLQKAIAETKAERVFVTHGQVAVMVRWLREHGLDAQGFVTEYGDEEEAHLAAEAAVAAAAEAAERGEPAPVAAGSAADPVPEAAQMRGPTDGEAALPEANAEPDADPFGDDDELAAPATSGFGKPRAGGKATTTEGPA